MEGNDLKNKELTFIKVFGRNIQDKRWFYYTKILEITLIM